MWGQEKNEDDFSMALSRSGLEEVKFGAFFLKVSKQLILREK